MAECITAGYKTILLQMVQSDEEKAVVERVIDRAPICEQAAERERARKAAEPWGIEPTYYDEKGKKQPFSSISAAIKALGLPMSGIQCDAEGKKCRAQSAVEILQIHGYIVTGNGEPKKAGEGGTKLSIYHPKSPQAKKLAAEG